MTQSSKISKSQKGLENQTVMCTCSLISFLHMFPEPFCKRGFAHLPACHVFHQPNGLHGVKFKMASVIGKEYARDDPGGTFVTICEPVVSGKAKKIARCQFQRIWIIVRSTVYGACQGGFNGSLITDAIHATMLCDLALMNGQNEGQRYPAP